MAEVFRAPVFANLEGLEDSTPDVIQNLLLTTLVVVVIASPFVSGTSDSFQENVEDQVVEVSSNLLASGLLQDETVVVSYPEYPETIEVLEDQQQFEVQNLLLSTLAVSGTTYTFTPSGDIAFSGVAPFAIGKVFQPSGSIQFSGAADLIRGRVFEISGQIVFSGTAPFTTLNSYTFIPSGSVVFAGTNTLVRGKAFTPSGTIDFSGTALFVRGKVFQPSGEITFNGGVTNLTRGKVWEPSGGITFSRTNSLIFTPAGGSPVSVLSKISVYVSKAMRLS